METLAQSIAAATNKLLGDAVTYDGGTIYALLDFDVALYPRGFQSAAPVSVNLAVFVRSEVPSSPVGETFIYSGTTYTILQIVSEESDTNSMAVLFE